MRYLLDDEWTELAVEGPTAAGGDEVLLDRDDDLTRATPWAERGYAVAPFLDVAAGAALVGGVTDIIAEYMRTEGVSVGSGFALERYHEFVDDEAHARVIAHVRRCFPVERLPVARGLIEGRVSEVLGVPVTADSPHLGEAVFCVRVVRPGSPDNNPPHRDVWLDRLRDAVNIYAPIAGSDRLSSLPLVPGSHRWRESEIERTSAGAKIGGLGYTVPAVTGSSRPLAFVRPDPAPGEVLVFSPYLIHGGALNRNRDRTRCSLEMRFWRRGGKGG